MQKELLSVMILRKAFVVAQQDMAKMVDSLVKELDDTGDAEKLTSN